MREEYAGFLFDNMKDGVCIIEKNGCVAYANPAAAGIFCEKVEHLLGKKVWQIIPLTQENDAFLQLFIDSVAQRQSRNEAIVDYVNGDGVQKKLRVCMHYAGKEAGERNTLVFVITDLTELDHVQKVFSRYTSTEIADYVLGTEGGEKIGGDLREVTILMSDLRGFTALCTGIEPNALIKMINHYIGVMSEIIEKHRGTIVEILGDGLFVMFNAPNRIENHAAEAVACALEMEKGMRQVNEWNRANGYSELQMGIGINTGEAVVGNIGSSRRAKYSCLGDVSNLAGRVESYTVGGQIYISENTKRKIREKLLIAGEQPVLPKGAAKELMIYDVVGIGGAYNICCEREKETWKKLEHPEEVTFSVLEGKHVRANEMPGKIVALSPEGAILETEAALSDNDNILLRAEGKLYGKVLQKSEEGYRIRFTSGTRKPDAGR